MPGPLYIKRPEDAEVLQGDIYVHVPSIYVDSRPLRVARFFQKNPKTGRDIYFVHAEEQNPPKDGFNWNIDKGGVEENVLVHGHVAMAVVVSHDCEIENDPSTRTLAMIRPANHLDEDTQAKLFGGGEVFVAFPLKEQDEEPKIERSFVDFRRLTTVRPDVLGQSTRVATLCDELREAMAQRFWEYLFRRVLPGAGSS